jgi:hypothetical protein
MQDALERSLERAPSTLASAARMQDQRARRLQEAAGGVTVAVAAAPAAAEAAPAGGDSQDRQASRSRGEPGADEGGDAPQPLHPLTEPLRPAPAPPAPPPVAACDAILMTAESLSRALAVPRAEAVEEARAAAEAARLADLLDDPFAQIGLGEVARPRSNSAAAGVCVAAQAAAPPPAAVVRESQVHAPMPLTVPRSARSASPWGTPCSGRSAGKDVATAAAAAAPERRRSPVGAVLAEDDPLLGPASPVAAAGAAMMEAWAGRRTPPRGASPRSAKTPSGQRVEAAGTAAAAGPL